MPDQSLMRVFFFVFCCKIVKAEGGDMTGGRRMKSLKIIVLGIIASEQPSAFSADTRRDLVF